MKQVFFFLMWWLCVCDTYGQSNLTYEVKSIFPRHLVEPEVKSDPALDQNGFLWNCSPNGIQCFDGEKVISYNDNYESNSLRITKIGNGYVNGIIIEKRYYWAVEKNSSNLICFDTQTRKIVKRLAPPEGKIYHVLQKDDSDNLFIICSSKDHSINQIYQIENQDTIHQFFVPIASVIRSYVVLKGNHWFRFPEAVQMYDSVGTVKKALTEKESSCQYFSEGPRERVVLSNRCYTEAFLYDSELDSLIAMQIPDPLKDNHYEVYHFGDQIWFIGQQISAILFDSRTNTLEDYSAEIIHQYRENENSNLVHKISNIFSDGNEGYYIYSTESLMHLTPKTKGAEDYLIPIAVDKPTFSMRASAEDEHGNIYTSFYTGVAIKEKDADTFFEFRNTSSALKVKEATYSLSTWENKLIWNNIIFDLETKEQSFIHTPDYGTHMNHNIQGDTLWTFEWLTNRLIKTDLKSGKSIIVKDKVYKNSVWTSSFIYDANEDMFWISTANNGILAFDKGGNLRSHYNVKTISGDSNLSSQEMIKQDSTIWFGTLTSFVSLDLRTEEIKQYQSFYTKSNGEQSPRSMYSIFSKNDSILYLGTNHGLVRFNTNSKRMDALHKDHGLAELEFNRNSMFQASDGRYYFGTVNGIYAFHEEELEFEEDEIIDTPTIYKIKIASNNTAEERTITSDIARIFNLTLQPDESFVTIGLTSPAFGENSGYRYQFERMQQDWIDGNGSSITIPSLEPGSHTLRLKNAKESIEKESNYAQINIYKKQFWYKKNWVIGFFVFVLIGLITILQRWIFGQKLKREKELAVLRTKISSDLHDDVGSILSGLAMQSEMLTYQVDADKKKELNEISSMSRDAMDRMRDTVWSIDSRKDKYENLIDRMRAFAEKTLERKGIDHNFTAKEIDGKKSISPTLRQNVYLIFKEAITNIVKHSSATNVNISISKSGENTHLIISDNGTIPNSDTRKVHSDGLGLSNMQLRADRIKGRLKIDKENGFKVDLIFKS